jgi:hypothetical protein
VSGPLRLQSSLLTVSLSRTAVHIQIEEINKRLRAEDLGIPADLSKRYGYARASCQQYNRLRSAVASGRLFCASRIGDDSCFCEDLVVGSLLSSSI